MAEKIISPGVFTNEIDQSFLPGAIADIGAAIVGPTVKGPVLIPTVVSSYSEFQAKFGDVFETGSVGGTGSSHQYLTSHAAEQYLKNSDTLTVVRVLAGDYSNASVTISSSIDPSAVGSGSANTGSFTILEADSVEFGGTLMATSASITAHNGSEVKFIFTASAQKPGTTGGVSIDGVTKDTSTIIYVNSGSGANIAASRKQNAENLRDAINISQSLHSLPVSASTDGANLVGLTSSKFTNNTSSIINGNLGTFVANSSSAQLTPLAHGSQPDAHFTLKGLTGDITTTTGSGGGTDLGQAASGISSTAKLPFTLKTFGDGEILNSTGPVGDFGLLESGSISNVRFNISSINNSKGTFTLQIRRGNDTAKKNQILETYSGVNLDPDTSNYIGKMVGDQHHTLATDENGKPFLKLNGSYPNRSNYVRVSDIATTIDYIDQNGDVRLGAASASLPTIGSGSSQGGFSGGSDGDVAAGGRGNFTYENISENNSQGLDISDDGGSAGTNQYIQALDLLSNQDEYDVNLILVPGAIASIHGTVTSKVIDVCEDRGDCFTIVDPVEYDKNVIDATAQSDAKDSNFTAMYWPWVKVPDSQIAGTFRWVPPSVVMGGIYAFNDKVAHPWFAPAGLNRGGIDVATQVERKLSQSERDTLYDSHINPIATFPGQGICVWGQKTLQKKNSALDRINVRRLLIKVKKFIASSSRFLVFEQNTAATRRRFLGIVNPYLENVQSQSGLNAFRVVMNETNNTPDTIDRNQLVGQLFLQPTRTAEFIVLDFAIQPTGASFPE
jgi:hypothetical protein